MNRISQLAINEEGFVFDPTTGQSFTVNRGGLEILRGLKQGKGVSDIARELGEIFKTVPKDVERDVVDFIGQLKIFRIVEE
jgi:hypothetical protein